MTALAAAVMVGIQTVTTDAKSAPQVPARGSMATSANIVPPDSHQIVRDGGVMAASRAQ